MATQKIKFKGTFEGNQDRGHRLIREYGVSDAGGLLILQAFADSDTMERDAQDIVNREGMTLQTDLIEESPSSLTVIRMQGLRRWPRSNR